MKEFDNVIILGDAKAMRVEGPIIDLIEIEPNTYKIVDNKDWVHKSIFYGEIDTHNRMYDKHFKLNPNHSQGGVAWSCDEEDLNSSCDFGPTNYKPLKLIFYVPLNNDLNIDTEEHINNLVAILNGTSV